MHQGLPADSRINEVNKLPRATRIILRCASCVSVIFFLLFLLKPVAVAQFIGTSAVILLAAASWIVYGSLAIYAGHKYGIAVIIPSLIVAAIFSVTNDNHGIRYLKR